MSALIYRVHVAHLRDNSDWGSGVMSVFRESGEPIFGPDRTSDRWAILWGANPVRTAVYTVDVRVRGEWERKLLLDVNPWNHRERCQVTNMEGGVISLYHNRTGNVVNHTVREPIHSLVGVFSAMGVHYFNMSANRVKDVLLPWANAEFTTGLEAMGMRRVQLERDCACHIPATTPLESTIREMENPPPN